MAQDRTTVQLATLILRKDGAFPAAARAHLSHIHSAEQLERWLAEWATPDDRRRLNQSVRQARYRQRHATRRVPVSPETHARLSARARQAGVPLSKFLDQLTNEATP
jgi:macrodomain Ter protein organizer (MatP/YcbG family)